MSALVTIRLRCDGPSCKQTFAPPADVRTIRQARTVAYRDHGWSTRSRDLCPPCRKREAGA